MGQAKHSARKGKRKARTPIDAAPETVVNVSHAPPVFRVPLRDVMSSPVITVRPADPLQGVAKTMNRHRVGCVVVLDQSRPVGIVTERDILRRAAKVGTVKDAVAEDVMTAPIIGAPESLDLASAIRIMVVRSIKKLPVLDGSRLVGIVTLEDFARIEPVLNSLFLQALEEADARARKHLRKHLHEKPPPWTFI